MALKARKDVALEPLLMSEVGFLQLEAEQKKMTECRIILDQSF